MFRGKVIVLQCELVCPFTDKEVKMAFNLKRWENTRGKKNRKKTNNHKMIKLGIYM